jgi:predicted DNA-binding transcriptional regulator AlpA
MSRTPSRSQPTLSALPTGGFSPPPERTIHDEILLTTVDLARRWQTSEQAVYAARHRGEGPRAVKRGRRLLWRLKDIESWEEARAASDADRVARLRRR